MCVDCGCRSRITRGDESLRSLTVMMNSGSKGLKQWMKETHTEPMTMEEVVALRHGLSEELGPVLAAELDKIIANAEGT